MNQKGIAPLIVVIGVLVITLLGGIYFYTHRTASYRNDQLPADSVKSNLNSPPPTYSKKTESGQEQISELKIVDGNVYQGSQLLISKKDCNSGNNSDEYLNINDFNLSPDKAKILLFGEEGLSVKILCYTALNPIHVQYIGPGIQTDWSHNSRYLAYTSKPADAGPVSMLYAYDTQLNKSIDLRSIVKINNLKYDDLGFSNLVWLNDDSGIKVNYQAFKNTDIPWGSLIGEGETTVLLSSTNK